ncbi:S-phase kinase-associated protein 2 isoform X2 [Salarias fasciatus]|uniref:S-phase kinase-associated protein 2 isoform X2 n=1 Tax=Salarias fasciatus TaxID=181472 RepID=UPI001176E055|nr:S-phase kinase-associated protein 2 isoform X2 [Salarias fasciatus]
MPNKRPLQELQSLQGSSRTKRSKPRGGLGEGLDSECTPTSSCIQLWSPPHKQLKNTSKGKENEDGQFVLGRRSRRRKESSAGLSWDHLPDELLLRVLLHLRLQDLVRVSAVCMRWRRLAFDRCLWSSVDLEGLVHAGPALQQVLKIGVSRLRCPRCCVEELRLADAGPLPVTHMDLSSSIIPTPALEGVLRRCTLLQCVSLEGLQLSDSIMASLASNPGLLQLNLSGCSGFSAAPLGAMLRSCSSVTQLNVSWCHFTADHVKSVVDNVTPAVTRLNLSGYRESLSLDDVKVLVDRCPHIQTLDLSDCTLLTAESFPVLKQLPSLQHLSLSRCYHIHMAALTDVGRTFPSLALLDVFGLGQDAHLPGLKKQMPHIGVNSRPFSGVARPTPAGRLPGTPADRAMWGGRCRLRFRL